MENQGRWSPEQHPSRPFSRPPSKPADPPRADHSSPTSHPNRPSPVHRWTAPPPPWCWTGWSSTTWIAPHTHSNTPRSRHTSGTSNCPSPAKGSRRTQNHTGASGASSIGTSNASIRHRSSRRPRRPPDGSGPAAWRQQDRLSRRRWSPPSIHHGGLEKKPLGLEGACGYGVRELWLFFFSWVIEVHELNAYVFIGGMQVWGTCRTTWTK